MSFGPGNLKLILDKTCTQFASTVSPRASTEGCEYSATKRTTPSKENTITAPSPPTSRAMDRTDYALGLKKLRNFGTGLDMNTMAALTSGKLMVTRKRYVKCLSA
uniref:Uncharacterized protein n=1 Tax=Anopheles farauti TaxID=69004 RepID=A0A182QJG3_9DIPT